MEKQVFLVCNAHLDPVWQWEWPVGMAEALSTFRIAANFCEEYEGFVFNHNEALLYRWVEELDPVLFARIQRLVAEGRWHIMGGWYIQPDCLLSSGESLLRQIRVGREYFAEKFGQTPTVAMNVDSFGHDKGLVQILKKSGYTGYLIGRQGRWKDEKEVAEFVWEGHNGCQIPVHRAYDGYNSLLGKSADKIRNILARETDKERLMILWGIGNHGGGPSRIDLQKIDELSQEIAGEHTLVHSTPEAYFDGADTQNWPHVTHDLTPIMVGCYSSMRRIKQLHAQLENLLLQTEKLCCAAAKQAGAPYPTEVLAEAETTLLFNEFHDILPGSSIREAETAAVQAMGGAIESLKTAQAHAFMRMAADYPAPPTGCIPIFVYNPHPWAVDTVTEADFMMPDQNWENFWTDYDVYDGDTLLSSQLVKENSTIPLDWSKRVAIRVSVPAFTMKRLLAWPKKLEQKPSVSQPEGDTLVMHSGETTVSIDRQTGWIASYTVGDVEVLKPQAGQLRIVADDEDPWGMRVSEFPHDIGAFRLATAEEAAAIAGLPHSLEPVRLIENGPVRSAVEAVFVYEQSHAVITYALDHVSQAVSVHIRLSFQQANHMVKWQLPTAFAEPVCCIGQGVFGHRVLFDDGRENAAQRWLAAATDHHALTVANKSGVYASSFQNGVLQQTLVRTPAYCAHPIEERPILPADRCLPHIDIGVHDYDFVLSAGTREDRLNRIEHETQVFNEPPIVLSMFTAGNGEAQPAHFVELDNPAITMTSCRPIENGVQLRLFNQTELPQTTTVYSDVFAANQTVTLAPMEYTELSLMER